VVEQAEVEAYLGRIGVTGPVRPDAEALRELQEKHLLAVPFENLSIHLGEPIVLDERALVEKIVGRRRGGFCYELNGAFAALLSALGFGVTRLAARVFSPDGLGPPFDHMTLRVQTPQAPEPWLVDVGFGRFSRYPLRLDSRAEQGDPAGVFVLRDGERGDVDAVYEGTPQYRIELRPRELADYVPTCWWAQTSPASHFTRSLVCSRLTETGMVTLAGRTLIRTVAGERQEQALAGDAEVLAAYRDAFGIELDRVPALQSAPHLVAS
jgi:N-hydroxyarylamine O-acetyltransferase